MPKVDTGAMVENAESTEFAGKAIVALATGIWICSIKSVALFELSPI